jgi:hypothetical protein
MMRIRLIPDYRARRRPAPTAKSLVFHISHVIFAEVRETGQICGNAREREGQA